MAPVVVPERRPHFASRQHAGRTLARQLSDLVGRADVVVVGLPPGGVAVGSEIAQVLGAPLDTLVVRTLPVPDHAGLTMGAVGTGGMRTLDRELIDALALPWPVVERALHNEHDVVCARERELRLQRRPLSLADRIVVLVDDGGAAASTIAAAVRLIRMLRPAQIIVALPVAANSSRDELCGLADRVVCPLVPASFRSAADCYEVFTDLADADVRGWLGLGAVSARC